MHSLASWKMTDIAESKLSLDKSRARLGAAMITSPQWWNPGPVWQAITVPSGEVKR